MDRCSTLPAGRRPANGRCRLRAAPVAQSPNPLIRAGLTIGSGRGGPGAPVIRTGGRGDRLGGARPALTEATGKPPGASILAPQRKKPRSRSKAGTGPQSTKGRRERPFRVLLAVSGTRIDPSWRWPVKRALAARPLSPPDLTLVGGWPGNTLGPPRMSTLCPYVWGVARPGSRTRFSGL